MMSTGYGAAAARATCRRTSAIAALGPPKSSAPGSAPGLSEPANSSAAMAGAMAAAAAVMMPRARASSATRVAGAQRTASEPTAAPA